MKLYQPNFKILVFTIALICINSSISYSQFKMLTDFSPDAAERELEFSLVKSLDGKLFVNTNSDISGTYGLYEESLWIYSSEGDEIVLENRFPDQDVIDVVGYDGNIYWIGDSENGLALWLYDEENGTTGAVDMSGVSIVEPYENQSLIIEFNDLLIFTGEDDNSGYGLWSFDGVSVSIIPVSDGLKSSPYGLIVMDDILYFSAVDENNDVQLWSYNGINQPEIVATEDTYGSGFDKFIVFKDKLYCYYSSGLFVYDEQTGLSLIEELSSSYPNLTISNEHLYYTSYNKETTSYELWSYDGDNDPVKVELDVEVKRSLTEFNNKLYFRGFDTEYGNEFWSYDVVSEELLLIQDINSGSANSSPISLTVFGNELIFLASDSDDVTSMWSFKDNEVVKWEEDFIPATESSELIANDACSFNGRYAFDSRSNGITSVDEEGKLISLIDDKILGNANNFMVFNNDLYGMYYNQLGDKGLWKYNLNGDLISLNENFEVDNHYMAIIGSTDTHLYIDADDGVSGQEIWKLDGSDAMELIDVWPGATSSSPLSSNNGAFIEYNEGLFFSAKLEGVGTELLRYDGMSTPELVSDILPGEEDSNPICFELFNDKMFFSEAGDLWNQAKLWSYDGDTLILIADLTDDFSGSSAIRSIKKVGDYLYFRVAHNEETYTSSLYIYDEISGVVNINDKYQDLNVEGVRELIDYKGWLYFKGISEGYGNEIWRFDGVNDPEMVMDIYQGSESSGAFYMRVVGDHLYFEANDGVHGAEIWMTEKKGQQITIGDFGYIAVDNEPFAIDGTTSSGLNISYTSSDESVATVSEDIVTVHSLGQTTITAMQEGNDEYDRAAAIIKVLEVQEVLAVDDNSIQPDKIIVYPNPTKSILNVSSTEGVYLKVFDLNGVPVFESKELKNVDVSSIKSGLYLLDVYDKDGVSLKHHRLMIK